MHFGSDNVPLSKAPFVALIWVHRIERMSAGDVAGPEARQVRFHSQHREAGIGSII